MKNFIVLEGIDGAGTTTQAHRLVSSWSASQAVFTCEPTDGRIGQLIRSALVADAGWFIENRALALLFAADRQQHVQEIRRWIGLGLTVVCDRYVLSSWAYQGMHLDLDWIKAINADLPVPDLTILIDVAPKVAQLRRLGREGAPDHFEVPETQRILADRYRELIHACPGPTAIVDGSQDIAQVSEAVRGAVFQASPYPGFVSAEGR